MGHFDDYPDFQPKITHPKHFSRQCIPIYLLTKLKPLILLFRFWGWGGEDDDLFTRVKTEKLTIFRENQELGRFKVLI